LALGAIEELSKKISEPSGSVPRTEAAVRGKRGGRSTGEWVPPVTFADALRDAEKMEAALAR
jgi:hypothetical protein